MISVIIPTQNDEQTIKSTIANLQENAYKRLLKEIIVVDAGSTDNTVQQAENAGATVIRSIRKGRAALFNLGAELATGKVLYFLTPGSILPKNFTNDIVRATQQGYFFGLFSMKFNYRHWLLNALSTLSKKKINFARIEGQSLFVMQELFEKTGKFREDFFIHEDLEMINRLKRYSKYIILNNPIIASIQKYTRHGVLRTELTYLITRYLYRKGYSQEKLQKISRWLMGEQNFQNRTQDALSASFN